MSIRDRLATEYLSGAGIELGALHHPFPTPPAAKVTYVDRMSTDDLRKHYPELADKPLTSVDIIDNGESLATIADSSQDFIIASHMLEHCQNPLGTLREHFKKLKPGGIGYYVIPNKHYTFDQNRDCTEFAHLVYDDQIGPAGSREQHYREVVTYTEQKRGPEAVTRIKELMNKDYSIHFHVWNDVTLYDFLLRANEYLGNIFTVEAYEKNGQEVICVLRKQSDPELNAKLAELGEKLWQGVPMCERASQLALHAKLRSEAYYYKIQSLRDPHVRQIVSEKLQRRLSELKHWLSEKKAS